MAGIFAAVLSGCGFMRNIALDTAGPILVDQKLAMNHESDYELARTALPSSIKLLEGLIMSYPQRNELKLWVCEALCGYAVGFVEDEDTKRASQLYLRAKKYALDNARRRLKFRDEYTYEIEHLQTWISSVDKKNIGALYWLAHSWGSYISINLRDPEAMADLPKVRWMMERVLELDESYYHAGAHIFLGSVYGSIPVMFGGSDEKSKYHFQRSFELTDEKFLLAHYYFAKTYCVRFQKKSQFEQAVDHITQFDAAQYPHIRLVNTIAKHKISQLKHKTEELFFDDDTYQ